MPIFQLVGFVIDNVRLLLLSFAVVAADHESVAIEPLSATFEFMMLYL